MTKGHELMLTPGMSTRGTMFHDFWQDADTNRDGKVSFDECTQLSARALPPPLSNRHVTTWSPSVRVCACNTPTIRSPRTAHDLACEQTST